jgi:hypothetical protein
MNILLNIIFLCTIVTAVNNQWWVPSTQYNDSYSNIFMATSFFVKLPVKGTYSIIQQKFDSPQIDVCSFYAGENCTNFFCRNRSEGYVPNFDSNSTRNKYQNMWIYCTYCDYNELPQFRKALSLNQCRYYFPTTKYENQCNEGEKQVFFEKIVGNLLMVSNSTLMKSSPFACFCPGYNIYSFQCDQYIVWILMKSFIFPLIHLCVMILVFIITLFFSTIPILRKTIRVMVKIYGEGLNLHRDRILALFNVRLQCSVFLNLCAISYMIEQSISIATCFYASEATYKINSGGFFRLLGIALLLCGFSCLLVLWTNICSEKDVNTYSGLNMKSGLILLGFYSLLSVAATITYLLFLYAGNEVAFSVMGFFVLIYVILFPVSFLFYGIRLYRNLTRYKLDQEKIPMAKQKIDFTKYMLVNIVFFFISFIVCTLVTIGYIIGWDYMGVWLGLARNFFLDICATFLYLSLTYMSIDQSLVDKAYPCLENFRHWINLKLNRVSDYRRLFFELKA